jgi:hypothetical protein
MEEVYHEHNERSILTYVDKQLAQAHHARGHGKAALFVAVQTISRIVQTFTAALSECMEKPRATASDRTAETSVLC